MTVTMDGMSKYKERRFNETSLNTTVFREVNGPSLRFHFIPPTPSRQLAAVRPEALGARSKYPEINFSEFRC
jgi:hypothetical protein